MQGIKQVLYNPAVYLSVIFLFGLVVTLWFPLTTPAENARYLLSALAQAQAAVIAILISLTIIAVQLSSQAYSSRASEIFIKQKAFWALVLLYIVSILFDFIILGGFPENTRLVSLSVFAAIIAFASLPLFIKTTLDALKPRKIIEKLVQDVDKVSLRYEINSLWNKDAPFFAAVDQETLLQPVVDVIKASILKGDRIAAKDGIKEIKTLAGNISQGTDEPEFSSKTTRYFLRHLSEIWTISLFKNDEFTTAEIVLATKEIIKSRDAILYVRTELKDIFSDAFCRNFFRNDWENNVRVVISSLEEIGKQVITKNRYEVVDDINYSLEEIKEILKGKEGYEWDIAKIAELSLSFCQMCIKNQRGSSLVSCWELSESAAKYLISRHYIGTIPPLLAKLEKAAISLIDSGLPSQNDWWDKAFRKYLLLDAFAFIGIECVKNEYSSILPDVLEPLKTIGLHSVKKGGELTTDVIDAIESIGRAESKMGGIDLDFVIKAIQEIEKHAPTPIQNTAKESIKNLHKELIHAYIAGSVWDLTRETQNKLPEYLDALKFSVKQLGCKEIVEEAMREIENDIIKYPKDTKIEEMKALKRISKMLEG